MFTSTASLVNTRNLIVFPIERDSMDLFRICSCFCILIAAIFLPVSAAESGTSANQTINDQFVVKLPADWSHFAVNSYAGMATGVMDNNDITNVISIQVYQNMNCSQVIEENLKVNLDIFNAKAGIASLSEPEYGTDNVTQYGKYSDGKTSNLFLRLIHGNVVAVFGSYETMDDAKEKSEEFSVIAASVIPLHPSVNELCVVENQKPTPVPTTTYKPRPVPTVSNTIAPTEAPVS
ncbi:hypothetical protein DSECCO2_59100 [anaerobic digester metagenome]